INLPMFRIVRSIVFSTVFVAGCATDPSAPVVTTRTVTKVVMVKEPGRTCKIETRQLTSAEFCATKPKCSAIKTCAEAYYFCAQRARWRHNGQEQQGAEP